MSETVPALPLDEAFTVQTYLEVCVVDLYLCIVMFVDVYLQNRRWQTGVGWGRGIVNVALPGN